MALGRGRGSTLYAAGFLESLPFLTAFLPSRTALGSSFYFTTGSPKGLAVDPAGSVYVLRGEYPSARNPDRRGEDVVITKISP